MIQNILALIVVFIAAIISIYWVVKSLMTNKSSGCHGCTACEPKNFSKMKIDKSKLRSATWEPRVRNFRLSAPDNG